MTRLYARNPHVTERRMDDVLFLAHPDTDALYQLNVTGTALWTLMESPLQIEDALDALTAAFPDQPRDQIAADINTILADFEANDLIA